jgi:hypothetical protein
VESKVSEEARLWGGSKVRWRRRRDHHQQSSLRIIGDRVGGAKAGTNSKPDVFKH